VLAASGVDLAWQTAEFWRRQIFAALPAGISCRIKGAGWQPACPETADMLDPIAQHIERYMDLLSARQKMVAANIANADTPGYKTRDLDFQSEFQRAALQSTDTTSPSAVEVPGLKIKNDGNNVSVDREARLLAENALRFHIAAELMRSELRMVRSAVTEGKNA